MILTEENLHLCVLPEGKSEKLYHDDDLPGLGVRVRRDVKGRVRRKWFYQYRSKADGTQSRMSLGNVDSPAAVPATKARQAATAESIKVQVGDDPQKERKAAKKGTKKLFLVEALKYLDDRLNGIIGKRPMKLSTYKAAKRYFELHWASLRTRPVGSITNDEVKVALRKIIEDHGKTAAIRAKANLSAFFVWALKEGIAKINPVINTHSISENPPRKRRFEDNEIKAIWSACRDDDFGRIVKLLFLTACRRDEIGGLQWPELDFDTGAMTIPGARTKPGREHKLILPPLAVKLLQDAPRRANREFVFGVRGGAFSRWSYEKLALEKRLAEAGHRLPQFGLHDIRRTVRTGMGKLGIKPHIAELVLNHVGHKAGIVGTYDWHAYAPEIKEALETWAEHLITIVKGPDSKVTQLKRA